MSKLRLAGSSVLLIAAALVGGTIIGSVAAATAPQANPAERADPQVRANAPVRGVAPAAEIQNAKPDAEAAAKRCADFRKAFAANLGVEESALVPAAKKAAISMIDAAVADGRMTKEAGEKLKARVDGADTDACRLLAGRIGAGSGAGAGGNGGGRDGDGGGPALGVAKDGLSAAAKALGMTPAELGAALRSGETLKQVATAKGVAYATVSEAVVAAVKGDLDAAVAAGKIAQARADRILERLTKNLADGRLRNGRPANPGGPAGRAAPTQPTTGG